MKAARWANGRSATDSGGASRKIIPRFTQRRSRGRVSSPKSRVAYVDGKYVFDFRVVPEHVGHPHGWREADLDLNIGAQSDGCFMAHIPADTVGHGGNTDYICTIPFQVGRRAFGSLEPAR